MTRWAAVLEKKRRIETQRAQQQKQQQQIEAQKAQQQQPQQPSPQKATQPAQPTQPVAKRHSTQLPPQQSPQQPAEQRQQQKQQPTQPEQQQQEENKYEGQSIPDLEEPVRKKAEKGGGGHLKSQSQASVVISFLTGKVTSKAVFGQRYRVLIVISDSSNTTQTTVCYSGTSFILGKKTSNQTNARTTPEYNCNMVKW